MKSYLLILAIITVVYINSFIAGAHVANDFPLTSLESAKIGLSLPQVWSDRFSSGMGGYTAGTLWSWPIDLIYGFLSTIGINFSLSQTVIGIIIPISIAVFGFAHLKRIYEWSDDSFIVSTLFYLINTYSLLLVDGGQLSFFLAYCLIPICIASFISQNKKHLLLSIIVLSFSDIRMLYLLAIIFLIYLVSNSSKLLWRWSIVTGLSIILPLVCLHSYWLIPVFMNRSSILSQSLSASNSIQMYSFANILHSFTLLQPHWYKNIFGNIISPRFEFLAIPIVAFSVLIFVKKTQKIIFWTLLTLIGIFLGKGSHPPLSSIYSLLYSHVPGFILFRDPTKFFVFISLGFSFLFSEAVSLYGKKVKLFPCLLIIYFLSINIPIFTGKMTGIFSNPPPNTDTQNKFIDVLKSDKSPGRVLWLPSMGPLSSSIPSYPIIDGMELSNTYPFWLGTVGNYETQNFIREGRNMSGLIDILGIKYIAYTYPDPRRLEIKPSDDNYYNRFSLQLSNKYWINKTYTNNKSLNWYQTNSNFQPIFFPKKTVFSLDPNTDLNNGISKDVAIIPLDDFSITNRLKDFPHAIIKGGFINNLSLGAMHLKSSELIYPSEQLSDSPNSSGWWKRGSGNSAWLKNFFQTKHILDFVESDLGAGWAISEKTILPLSIHSNKIKEDSYILMRVVNSRLGGVIEVLQDGILIGSINTKIDPKDTVSVHLQGNESEPDADFIYGKTYSEWHLLKSTINSQSELIITAHGDVNAVNILGIVSPKRLLEIMGKSYELNKNQLTTNAKPDQTPHATWTRLSPTKYALNITGVNSPCTMAFSERFDSNWQLNGIKPVPLYGIINGFPIFSNGSYILEYQPQKYVYVGLVISLFTIIFIFLNLKKL